MELLALLAELLALVELLLARGGAADARGGAAGARQELLALVELLLALVELLLALVEGCWRCSSCCCRRHWSRCWSYRRCRWFRGHPLVLVVGAPPLPPTPRRGAAGGDEIVMTRSGTGEDLRACSGERYHWSQPRLRAAVNEGDARTPQLLACSKVGNRA